VSSETLVEYRGHFDECLRHFKKRFHAVVPKGSKGAADQKKPFAEFCSVGVPTITRWLGGDETPLGAPRLMCMFWLEINGYHVIELSRMKKVLRNFAELIAFRVITSQAATEIVGFSKVTSLYQVFYGQVGTSEAKETRMYESWKEHRQVLAELKERAVALYTFNSPAQKLHQTVPRQDSPATLETTPKIVARPPVVSMMDALNAMFAEKPPSNLSPDEVLVLREYGGSITELFANLNDLNWKLLAVTKLQEGP
jgi:hypothetical protein